MTYIKADGTIGHGRRPDSQFAQATRKISDKYHGLQHHWKIVVCVSVAFFCHRYLNPNPFSNGAIPAAAVTPSQHWERIAGDDMFVRSMTEHLGSSSLASFWKRSSNARLTDIKKDSAVADISIAMGTYDFGGPDGHVAEGGDWSDLKYVQGTRCSTTRSGVTAYFCGAEVAGNQDYALGSNRKMPNLGVSSFADFIACRHHQGQKQKDGQHRRSVYRFGIGCKDSLAGYSHAFSIVAQPDGSFYWLQSFIGHYSLQQWMKKTDAQLSLGELESKLAQVQRLMNITSWTDQANTDYLELFGVDKNKERMSRHRERRRGAWNPSHRLEYFVWDEACEYPVPPDPLLTTEDQAKLHGSDVGDECTLQMYQKMLGIFDKAKGSTTETNINAEGTETV